MSVGVWDPGGDRSPGPAIDPVLLDAFLRLSAAGPLMPEDLEEAGVALQQGVMTLGVDAWHVAENRTTADIRHLAQVFTLIEALPGWDAGAKSPVIGLVKILKTRGEFDVELRKWIKANSDNRYLPYGSAL